jgi:hypothetical protein
MMFNNLKHQILQLSCVQEYDKHRVMWYSHYRIINMYDVLKS